MADQETHVWKLQRSCLTDRNAVVGCAAGIPSLGTLAVFSAIETALQTNATVIAQLAAARNALLLSANGPDTVVTIA